MTSTINEMSACFESKWFGRTIDIRTWKAHAKAQRILIEYLKDPNCKIQEVYTNGFLHQNNTLF
ncbi:MAG: hypothetical protein HWD61_07365 [Parachlamydiaceae bacterium]|nr:MAG: hypothetical protein HWD61_07365 [Parachlamydiaceae bacterium]